MDGLTVRDLIEILKKYPEDLRVIVDGYEDGFNDISITAEVTLALNVNKEDYYGAHSEIKDSEIFPGDKEKIKETQKALRLAGKKTYAQEREDN